MALEFYPISPPLAFRNYCSMICLSLWILRSNIAQLDGLRHLSFFFLLLTYYNTPQGIMDDQVVACIKISFFEGVGNTPWMYIPGSLYPIIYMYQVVSTFCSCE